MSSGLYPENEDFDPIEIEDIDKYDQTDRNTYYYDFDLGDFLYNPDGSIVRCGPKRAYVQWCQKTLLTERYKRFAYPEYYGNEEYVLINSDLSREAIELEEKRMVTEALMVHPRTYKVENFQFSWDDNGGSYYTFDVYDTDHEKYPLTNKIMH